VIRTSSAGASADELFAAGYNLLPVASDISLLRDAAAETVRTQLERRGRGTKPAAPAAKSGY